MTTTVVVWLTTDQYTWLETTAGDNAAAETAWLADQRERLAIPDGQPLPEALHLELADTRPHRWPRQVHLVNNAIRIRLALPDLAGPWPPWTDDERKRHRIRGRRTGTPHQGFDRKCSYDLDTHLVDAARLAADRVSEPAIRALKNERLLGPSRRRGLAAAARRRNCNPRSTHSAGSSDRASICSAATENASLYLLAG
ncbi:hypothetical protein ABZ851_36930 [Streptomyces sp. NPDC047049]|uniref:hypothetical protein n=1 Tax=Streptomyces sp. NPDC047049 TaxID=3156688 RepID=UPI0033D37015